MEELIDNGRVIYNPNIENKIISVVNDRELEKRFNNICDRLAPINKQVQEEFSSVRGVSLIVKDDMVLINVTVEQEDENMEEQIGTIKNIFGSEQLIFERRKNFSIYPRD